MKVRLGLVRGPALKKHVYVTPVTAVNLTCRRASSSKIKSFSFLHLSSASDNQKHNGNNPGPNILDSQTLFSIQDTDLVTRAAPLVGFRPFHPALVFPSLSYGMGSFQKPFFLVVPMCVLYASLLNKPWDVNCS